MIEFDTKESGTAIIAEVEKPKIVAPTREDVSAMATQMAVTDEELLHGLSDAKKKSFIHGANAELKREEAEHKKADIELQEAQFGVYSGVAAYAGIKKALPQKMQNILFTILSAFQLIFLLGIGLPISIFNIICDSVDSAFYRLGTLTKSARRLVVALLGAGLVAFIVYIVYFYGKKFGIFA